MTDYKPTLGEGYFCVSIVCDEGIEHKYTVYLAEGEPIDSQLTFNGILCKKTAYHLINEAEKVYPQIQGIHNNVRDLVEVWED